jgi:hypothetical protein
MTGAMGHDWANRGLLAARLPVMQEVKVDRWLPEGWSGRVDWVFWNADLGGFVLGDLKTIKGDRITGSSWTMLRGPDSRPRHVTRSLQWPKTLRYGKPPNRQ